MTTGVSAPWQTRLRTGAWWRTYAGMVAAMFAGMLLGHGVSHMLFHDLGEVAELAVMAGWMSLGMVVWMAMRRDSIRATSQMVVAMNLPFAVVLPLLSADAIGFEAASGLGHVGMLATMAASMLVGEPCEKS